MHLAECLYATAFMTYLVGVALCYYDRASPRSVAVMTAGILIDFGTTAAMILGVDSLRMGIEGRNWALDVGTVLGFTVWLSFLATLVIWLTGRRRAFLVMALPIELVWFLCYISFLFGVHVYPLS